MVLDGPCAIPSISIDHHSNWLKWGRHKRSTTELITDEISYSHPHMCRIPGMFARTDNIPSTRYRCRLQACGYNRPRYGVEGLPCVGKAALDRRGPLLVQERS